MERSQANPGVWEGPIEGMPGSGTSGQLSGTGTCNVPHPSLENVILSPVGNPKEAKSRWVPRGMLMSQSASSGGELDLSTHKRKKPWGTGGLHLGTRASSSGGATPSGSDVVGSLGAGKPTGGSALGISNGSPPLEAGTKWVPPSHI